MYNTPLFPPQILNQLRKKRNTGIKRHCLETEYLGGTVAELGFPGGSEVTASAWNAGDPGSIPELGRSPGEGNGNPLQYSCLENPMDGA